MSVEILKKYNIDEWFVEKLRDAGIKNLYDHQIEALKKGITKGKNLVIAVPTASGKTLISMFAFFTHLKKRRKVVYLVPLVSLANEKFEEFKKYFDRYNIALSVGDYDSSDPYLENYDIIVSTVEKFDSLIRHKARWINDVGLVVFDEVHMISDPSRGPTLEIIATRIKEMLKNVQIIALSATISNVKELADWFGANYVISNFRPVRVIQGVLIEDTLKLEDGRTVKLNKGNTPEEKIVEYILGKKKQILFFVSTRKKAENLAEKLSHFVKKFVQQEDKRKLENIAKNILSVLENPTDQCKKLAETILNGVAFHHSGLLYEQRKIVENGFREGIIKVIVATTGLAYGVNLPSYCVVIRDLKRYYPGLGSYYIPILEYIQMVGRAGRPKYDNEGLAISIAQNEDIAEEIFERFVYGEPEELRSRLGNEIVLRSQTLAFVSIEEETTFDNIRDFFSKTFFSFQYGRIDEIIERIENILEQLLSWGFVVFKNDKVKVTRIGKRVSELYIDPKSAKQLIDGIKKFREKKDFYDEFSVLSLISNTTEMRSLVRVRNKEIEKLVSFVFNKENSFLFEIPSEWDLEFEYFLPSVKIALVLYDWINEVPENEITKKYGITPGDLRSIIEISDWMIYSLHEITRLLKYMDVLGYLKKLRVRLRSGVKEELLKFVRLKGIGRVRARKIFNHGIKSIEQLRKIPLATLSFIVGPKIAKRIKEQISKEETQKSIGEL